MAGVFNWFSFTSKEEREERSAEYFKRMFPLGAQQKTKEEELLQQLISAKTSDGDKLYQMLIVREALLQKDKGLLYFIAEEGLNISFLEELLSSDQLKQKTAMYWSPIKEKLKKKK